MANWYIDFKNGSSANSGKGFSKVTITSGGTYNIAVGDTITGATSGVTAKVTNLTNTSGSFGAGNWAGDIHCSEPRLAGAYSAFTVSETLNVGSNIDVGTVTSTTRYDSISKPIDKTTAQDNFYFSKTDDPTSLGSCKWFKKSWEQSKATVTITSATNATPIVCTSTAHPYVVGDYIYISGATANTAVNGYHRISAKDANTFTLEGTVGNGVTSGTVVAVLINPMIVEIPANTIRVLTTPVGTSAIWTTANSGTTGNSTTGAYFNTQFVKYGYTTSKADNTNNRVYIAQPASPVANTKYGSIQIGNGSNVDLSAYQKIWMAVYVSATTSSTQTGVIKLCSDTAGATPVNTFTLPAIPAISTWYMIELDNGSALGNNIQSIGYYSGSSAVANLQVSFGQIGVCKATTSADSLSLCDQISKNSTLRGSEAWYSPKQFLDWGGSATQAVVFGPTYANNNVTYITSLGYQGTEATATSYVIHPAHIALTAGTTGHITHTASGQFGDTTRCAFYGGVNIGTLSQDGETFYNARGTGRLGINGNTDVTRFSFSNGEHICAISAGTWENIEGHTITNCIGLIQTSHRGILSLNNSIWNDYPTSTLSTALDTFEVDKLSWNLSGQYFRCRLFRPKTANSIGYISGGYGNTNWAVKRTENFIIENNWANPTNFANAEYWNDFSFYNVTNNHTTEFSVSGTYDPQPIYSQKHDATANTYIYGYRFTGWIKDYSLGTGPCLGIELTTTRCRLSLPVEIPIGQFYVNSSGQVTITADIYKTHATRVAGRIGVRWGHAGITTDTLVECADTATTWLTTTLQFTPSAGDVVEIFAQAYMKNDSSTLTDKVYFDKITWSQA